MGGRPGRYSATLEKFVYFYIAHKNQFLTDYIIQIVLDCELQLSPYMYNRTCSSGFHLYNYYFVSQASLQVQIVAVFPILSGNQLSSIIIDNHDEICQYLTDFFRGLINIYFHMQFFTISYICCRDKNNKTNIYGF